MPAPQRTARIEDEIWDPAQARAKAEGASLGALMRAAVERYVSGDLTSSAEPASKLHTEVTSQPGPASQVTAPAISITGDGEPSHDTARYGLRGLVLCRACAAALAGETYEREIPPGAARLMRRGAA